MRVDAAVRALRQYVDAVVAQPALRDGFRAVFDAELTTHRVGWPRRLARASREGWIRPSDVLIELAPRPACEPFALGLLLHAASATRLIERMLGGPGDAAPASASGVPSDAECGVLAYGAARLCAAGDAAWLVRDVRTDARSLLDALDDALVLWPLTVHSTLGPIDGALLLSSAQSATFTQRHLLEVLVRDTIDPAVLATLAVGDVLVSDTWTLTDTIDGLTGSVVLAVEGTDTELRAAVRGSQLCADGPATAPRGDRLELVLMQHSCTFTELAALASGVPCTIPSLGSAPGCLRHDGHPLADGELVMHRGAVGIRITALHASTLR